jgi:catechol 2,3-dioxygenase-like lactoylglutathione lyase family enzyme
MIMPDRVIHHVDLSVSDFARSRAFYLALLAPLGLDLVLEFDRGGGRRLGGFGTPPDPSFWIRSGVPFADRQHVAFVATSRAAVDAFHAAGLTAGGVDNGAPGIRDRYESDYYAAYLLDPDGHNIEAVCRG